ncbi:MAG TPA: GGDEF domain-containing protein [Anaerolineales bacterium]|nr:GGDEF domain-containing protein [Anaerolineales bacterium]
MKADRILEILDHHSRLFWITTGITSIILLGIIDYLTGYEINFSLFYLAPIAAASWYADRRLGLTMSVLSSTSWLIAEMAAGQSYTRPAIHLWNTMIRFGFFVLVTYLLTELRRAHEVQRLLARTDYVSGAVNARHFNELLEVEIARAHRYQLPLTMAYIDVDDFKQVNDNFGHDTGDEVLHFIVSVLQSQLRNTDIVARMGGDEFALLLPMAGQPEAQAVIARLHADLTQQMRQKNWPVTFSIGAVTCLTAPPAAKGLIKMADEIMYVVKNSTKNSFRFLIYTDNQGQDDKGA